MSERIRGLSIGLDLDTLKLETGLSDVRSKMRLMNSEMRNNLSVFDRGERSVGKYETRITDLSKKIELQRVITDRAHTSYEKMVKEHGEGSKEAEKAATAYNRQSAELNNLERQIGRMSDELRELQKEQAIASSGWTKAGTGLITFGDQLSNVSEKMRETGGALTKYLTTPIAGFVGMVGGMGVKRAMDMEQVQFMLTTILDTEKEVESVMKGVTDLVTDTSFGLAEIANPVANLLSSNIMESDALLHANVAMELASLKGNDQLVPQLTSLIQSATLSGSIDGSMINSFANAGIDILAVLGNQMKLTRDEARELLREGELDIHDALRMMSEGILAGTEGVNGATVAAGGMIEKSGETLSGKWKNFRASIAQVGERMVMEHGIFDGLKEALDEGRDLFRNSDEIFRPMFEGIAWALESGISISKSLIAWFKDLDDTTKNLMGRLIGFMALVGPILVGLGTLGGIAAKVSKGLGSLFKFIGKSKVLTAFGKTAGTGAKKVGILSRAVTLLTGPVGIVIGAVSLLGAGFAKAYQRSEPLRNGISAIGDVFKFAFSEIRNFLSTNPQMISFFDLMRRGFDWIVTDLNKTWTGLVKVFDFLSDGFGVAIQKTAAVLMDALKLATPFLTSLTAGFSALFSGDFSGALGLFKNGFSVLFSGIGQLLDDHFGDMTRLAISKLQDWGTSTVDWFKALPGRIGSAISGAASAGSDWVQKAWDKTTDKLGEWGTSTIEWFKGVPSSIKNTVSGWVSASSDWVSESWEATEEKLGEWKDDLIQWFVDRGNDIGDKLEEWKGKISTKFNEIKDTTIAWFKGLPSTIKSELKEWGNTFENFLEEQHEENKRQYGEWGKAITDWISSIPSKLGEGFEDWKDTIVEWFDDTKEDYSTGLSEWWEEVSTWFSDSIEKLQEGFEDWTDTIVEWFDDTVKDFKKGFTDWKDSIVTWFEDTKEDYESGLSGWWKSITGWIDEKKTEWSDKLSGWTDAIVTWFKDLPGNTQKTLSDWFTNITDSIVNWKDNFVEGFESWWGGLKEWFTSLGDKQEIKDTGKQVVESIVQGCEEEKETFLDRLGSMLVKGILYVLGAIAVLAFALGRTIILKIIEAIKWTWNWLSETFDDLVNLGREKFNEMVRNTVQRMEQMRTDSIAKARETRDGIVTWITRMKDTAVQRVQDMRTEAVRRFTTMKDRFLDVGRDIRDGVRDRFDDLVESARELPGRIGDGIKNMASKVKEGVKSFANTIGSTLETGINKVVGGMNSLLSTIGVSLRVPEINIPAYAKGTKDHPGGAAVVGEKGRELAHIPGEGYTMLGIKGAELLNLPKGSSVLPNRETESILKDGMGLPGYETGVGRAFDWVKGKAQQGWQSAKNLASDAMGWLMDAPRRIFEKAMEFTGVSMPSADNFAGGVMRGAFTALRDGVTENLKKAQSEVTPGTPSFGSMFRMTSPFGWRTHPVTGDRRHHNGVDYAAPMGTPLMSQSAGNVTYSGWMGGYGNTVRVKSGIYDHYYAHNMRNIARVGQTVSKGQLLALLGSTGMSTGPHVHYEVRKNGTPVNPRGFETGGWIRDKMLALLGDGGYPEWVIPTDPARASEAMKLLALAGKDIESRGGAKRPHQLPNPYQGEYRESKDNKYLEKIIDKLSEQVEDTKEIVTLLAKILMKDSGITLKELSRQLHSVNDDTRRRGGGTV